MADAGRDGGGSAGRRMTAPRWLSPFVRGILRSPLHPLVSRTLMLLSVRGRRSGRTHTFPVGYLEEPDGWYVLVGDFERKTWWRNLEGGVPVRLTVRGRTLDASATVLRQETDGRGFEETLGRYLVRFPRTARVLGVSIVDGVPDADAVRAAARRVVVVRVTRPATA